MDAELHSAPAPSVPALPDKALPRVRGVRAMTHSDIPAVARLFSKTFRRGKTEIAPDLEPYLETLFFGSPLYRPEHGSIVHDSGNGVTSTLLAVPMEIAVHGRPVTAKLLCAFMADGREGAAGAARLARQMRVAGQEMCFSDTSSPVSADHWVAGGGMVLPVQSLEWHRSFRPLSAAALAGSRRLPLLRSRGLLHMLGWFDGALRRWRPSLRPTPVEGCRVVETGPDEFHECAGRMMERFAVHPVWSKPEFDWLVSVAAMNRSLGALRFRSVLDASGRVIGAFLFFGRDRQEAMVLNVLCEEGREFEVIGQMFFHLDAEGYAQASGIAQPFMMNAVLRQRWLLFKHRGYFCMFTRHAELRDAALRNDIYVGGLTSESWSRLLTDF